MNYPDFEKFTLYDESIVTIATNTSSPIVETFNQREMKTPMQELLEWVRATLPMDLDTPQMIEHKIVSLLEKEKEQIINAWIDDRFPLDKEWVQQCAEKYYNETYGGNK